MKKEKEANIKQIFPFMFTLTNYRFHTQKADASVAR
jgi:hypothetical protein